MRTENEADLPALFQSTSPPGRRVDCPEPERLWAAPAGTLSFPELTKLVDHSAQCEDCSEALRLARELRADGATGVEATIHLVSPQPRWLIGLALAAGLAGLVVLNVRHQRPNPEPLFERGPGALAMRSAIPDAPQARQALVLRWVPYPGAHRYNVTLATSDLRVLFQRSGLEQTEVPVPAVALEGIPPGARLFWRVEAALDDGRSVESPAFTLTLD
jgi:hypothetical protein